MSLISLLWSLAAPTQTAPKCPRANMRRAEAQKKTGRGSWSQLVVLASPANTTRVVITTDTERARRGSDREKERGRQAGREKERGREGGREGGRAQRSFCVLTSIGEEIIKHEVETQCQAKNVEREKRRLSTYTQ